MSIGRGNSDEMRWLRQRVARPLDVLVMLVHEAVQILMRDGTLHIFLQRNTETSEN